MPKMEGEIVVYANQRDVIVKNLTTTGRKWAGELRDGLYPTRGGAEFSGLTPDLVNDRIDSYAHEWRERWLSANPGLTSTMTVEAEPVIVEIEGDTTEAFSDGYNAGLMEGLRLAAEEGEAPIERPEPVALVVHGKAQRDVDAAVAEARDNAFRAGLEEGKREAGMEAYRQIKDANHEGYVRGEAAGKVIGAAEAGIKATGLENAIKQLRDTMPRMIGERAVIIAQMEAIMRQRALPEREETLNTWIKTYGDYIDEQVAIYLQGAEEAAKEAK